MIGIELARIGVVQRRVVTRVAELLLELELNLAARILPLQLVEDVFPYASCPFPRLERRPLPLRVEEKGPRSSRVRLILQPLQQLSVPLEPLGELTLKLVDAVKKLLENGARLFEGVTIGRELLGDTSKERLLSRSVVSSTLDKLHSIAAKVS